jgi:hypothetical protein
MVMNPEASFALARALHSAQGAPLGAVFSFVSGLYFRGKLTYAKAFGQATANEPSAYVMLAGGGLCSPDEAVTVAQLNAWKQVSVSEKNPHFTAPLLRHASLLLDRHDDAARFVLLGSVASNKYVAPLLEVFAERLLFPVAFAGMGDMSRGSLLLRAARDGRELEYAPVASRHAE